MTDALVVVAHPDDETIWCGGTILMNPEWRWTIISLCRKYDKERAAKFKKACRRLNAECSISDLEDGHPEQRLDSLGEVKMRILGMLKKKEFDFIFTHGQNGEYGHNRHKEVHGAVKELAAENSLGCRKIFFFSYMLEEGGQFCIPNARSADVTNVLCDEIARKKYLLITSVYGFSSGSFEEMSTQDTESFKTEDG